MKKFNLTFPPPPPPEPDLPKPHLYSPLADQQYSPSRATSPNSEEENGSIPLPPSSTATPTIPTRKVLGSDQAKRRLQAFAKAKFTNSPKGKSSMNFTDLDEGSVDVSVTSKAERKRYPLVKEATPVMASIMKEETQSRENVKKNMEKKNKSRDEVDLRDILNLRKKKDDDECDGSGRRSRSRERKRGAGKKYSTSSDRGRRREDTESPSPRQGRKDRRKDRSCEDIFNDSTDDVLKRRRPSVGSGTGRQSPDDKMLDRSRDSSTEKKKKGEVDRKRRSSGGSSMVSLDRHSSPARDDAQRKKEIKRKMPDLKDEMNKEKLARKDIDLWELKHGGRDVENNDGPSKLFTVDKAKKNELILIKANVEDDYREVKQIVRDLSGLVSNDEGLFLKFPSKYMKYTASGVCYSYNLKMSAEKYKGDKKSAQLRKSIDTMMFELENETKRKRSLSGENREISSSKKKKNKLENKKVKKRKRIQEKSDPGSKKKKKKTRAVKSDITGESEALNSSSESRSPDSNGLKGSAQNVTLSAAGVSKLFSMAGYADSENETKEKTSKQQQIEGFTKKKEEVTGDDYTGRVREEKYSPHTPSHDHIQYGASRSPSPSLIADLSRISHLQDEGPRLPKMKDSRSPSKIPIMRDGRSPITEEPGGYYSSPRKDQLPGDSPGIDYNPIRGENHSPRSPSRELDERGRPRQDFRSKRESSPNNSSPGRKTRSRQKSPARRGRTPSPFNRKDESRSRKSPPDERNRSYPADSRKSPDKERSPHSQRNRSSPQRRRSPFSGKMTPDRNRSPRKLNNKTLRSPDQSRSPHELIRSPKRNASPFDHRRSSDWTRSPFDQRRSPLSERKMSPSRGGPRTPLSPDSRRTRSPPYSPGRRSPEWRRGPKSPGRRGPVSPGRPRHPRTPSYSPGPRHRNRSPDDRRRGDRRSPRGRDYDYGSPDRRRRYSPDSRGYSPRHMRNIPDSTISDAELARQMPPPASGYSYSRFRQLSPGFSDSPKRLSLDERLEREHGIKIEQDSLGSLDFSRPPPAFPPPPGVQQQTGGGSLFRTGLPAMIPTYDDTLPAVMKGPPYPGTQKILNEKEQAMIAANAVASKLQEMQAAKEDERKKKKEQKFAERIALMEAVPKQEETNSPVSAVKVESGRILEEVEKQETEMKDVDKRKKKKEKDIPTLITLKPFYRPGEKKGVKKKRPDSCEAPEEDPVEEFTPRSPIPLPDKGDLRSVLMKPQLSRSLDKKAVRYADGVLPGQGSPDQRFSPLPAPACTDTKLRLGRKKKYKKVVLTVISQTGDSDSDEETPPPPPGSPPRFPYKELLVKYGSNQPVEATA